MRTNGYWIPAISHEGAWEKKINKPIKINKHNGRLNSMGRKGGRKGGREGGEGGREGGREGREGGREGGRGGRGRREGGRGGGEGGEGGRGDMCTCQSHPPTDPT